MTEHDRTQRDRTQRDRTRRDRPRLDHDTVRAALELAVRAPSIHNTQPWRFGVGHGHIDLYADPTRQLPATDPDGRDLLVSCGAALHHLRTGLFALGWLPVTRRLPDPARPLHLATVEALPRTAGHADLTLAVAISRRRTDRRAYQAREVPEGHLAELVRAASAHGVALRVVSAADTRARLASAIAEADQFQRAMPAYANELSRWTGDRTRTRDGVPTSAAPPAAGYGDVLVRQFDPAAGHRARESEKDGVGLLLVLGTAGDDRLARLRAGEATSAVLLTAARLRLAGCPLTQPLEIPTTRQLIRTRVLDASMIPQMVLRIGWPPERKDPFPATTRRPVSEVLLP